MALRFADWPEVSVASSALTSSSGMTSAYFPKGLGRLPRGCGHREFGGVRSIGTVGVNCAASAA